jgi:hypothetical protein
LEGTGPSSTAVISTVIARGVILPLAGVADRVTVFDAAGLLEVDL